jgi:diadenosine tetraphosphate (Ap4A) HIT family hydrolase
MTKNGAKGGDQGSAVDLPDMQHQLQSGCPFCSPAANRILAEDELTRTITDGFPVSPGHTLIIPRRHVATFFEATDAEQAALLCSLKTAKTLIEAHHQPDGYNIGVNNGAAAGQTVPHLHIHLIPRYLGDIPDPRGGVRWVLPEKAKYWGEAK